MPKFVTDVTLMQTPNITVRFESETVQDITAKLDDLIGWALSKVVFAAPLPPPPEMERAMPEPAASNLAEQLPGHPPKTRKKRGFKQEELPLDAPTPEAPVPPIPPVPPAPTTNKEDVTRIIRGIAVQFGAPAATSFVKKFKRADGEPCLRVTDIPPESYDAVRVLAAETFKS